MLSLRFNSATTSARLNGALLPVLVPPVGSVLGLDPDSALVYGDLADPISVSSSILAFSVSSGEARLVILSRFLPCVLRGVFTLVTFVERDAWAVE